MVLLLTQKNSRSTKQRLMGSDLVICMNQWVIDEAGRLTVLPQTVVDWNVIDIGEAHRTVIENREQYEEEIYREIIDKVDALITSI